jgi:hypothetical protein
MKTIKRFAVSAALFAVTVITSASLPCSAAESAGEAVRVPAVQAALRECPVSKPAEANDCSEVGQKPVPLQNIVMRRTGSEDQQSHGENDPSGTLLENLIKNGSTQARLEHL